jgi:hypothetical protein
MKSHYSHVTGYNRAQYAEMLALQQIRDNSGKYGSTGITLTYL